MKALILKDLYTTAKYLKSMTVLMLGLAFVIITFQSESSDISGIVMFSGILYGMTILTTFSFDDMCEWNKFALVSPVTKKDIIRAKFILLFIFSIMGLTIGTIIAFVYNLLAFGQEFAISELLSYVILYIISFSVSLVLSSTSLPFVYKFGVEKTRNYLLVTYIIPGIVFFGLYRLILVLNIPINEAFIAFAILLSPLAALLWTYVMYLLSVLFFKKVEI